MKLNLWLCLLQPLPLVLVPDSTTSDGFLGSWYFKLDFYFYLNVVFLVFINHLEDMLKMVQFRFLNCELNSCQC